MTEWESLERVTGMAVWWVTVIPETMAMAAAAVAAAAAMRFSFMTRSFGVLSGFKPGGLSGFHFPCLTSLVSLTGVAAWLAGKLHAGCSIRHVTGIRRRSDEVLPVDNCAGTVLVGRAGQGGC